MSKTLTPDEALERARNLAASLLVHDAKKTRSKLKREKGSLIVKDDDGVYLCLVPVPRRNHAEDTDPAL